MATAEPDSLYVATAGDHHAPAIVFIHAFPLTHHMWDAQMAELADTYFLIAPDLRGFGQSRHTGLVDVRHFEDGELAAELEARSLAGPHITEPRAMDAYAADVIAAMDRFDVEKAVICGLSLGGYVAFALHRHYPQRIAGLILADTRATPDTIEGRRARIAQMEQVAQVGPQAILDTTFPKMFAPNHLDSPAADAARQMLLSNTPESIIYALRELAARIDSTPYLKNILVPTMLIVGAEDTITPPSDAGAIRDAINGGEHDHAQIRIIPDAGHLSNLEAPDEFNAVVREFMQTFAH